MSKYAKKNSSDLASFLRYLKWHLSVENVNIEHESVLMVKYSPKSVSNSTKHFLFKMRYKASHGE